jgi:hypothetical protein
MLTRRLPGPTPPTVLAGALAAAMLLCSAAYAQPRRDAVPPGAQSVAPDPATPSLYGPPVGAPSKAIARVRPMGSAGTEWRKAPFYFIQTELSPATLYASTTRDLVLFAGLKESGAAPTHAAYVTAGTPRVVRAGQPMDSAAMGECWILVWFAGAAGRADWDSPWVVYLQRRPSSIRFTDDGLALRFPGASGMTVLMPLYGFYRPPQQGKEFLEANGLPSKGVQPWTWQAGLPEDVLRRVRWWANVMREFPMYCEDSYTVDRARDAVTLHQKVQFLSIEDDWRTPRRRFAPISPPLALAMMDGRFPLRCSRRVTDPWMFTPAGPYMGVEETDEYDVTFNVLQYIHEMEAPDPADEDDPIVEAALARLRKAAAGKFKSPDRYAYDHGGMDNFCWAVMGDQWYARGLPYYDETTRSNAIGSLKKYFHEDVLTAERFKEREFPAGSSRTYLILEGPGIGSWGVLGDAGKFSTNLLQTLWAYAHYTGDWDLLKQRWALVPRLFCTPAETRWSGFGRGSVAELGDEAAPCAALARMAWKVGDMNTYSYACYMFARELVHHYVKQRGAEYFRRNQPWHTMEPMPPEVYLTNLWGDTAGWQIDGPAYPAKTGERQHANRWVRFHSEDVARFYREHLLADVQAEMDLLTDRWDAKRRHQNASHIMPSLVQLRSLLLNEKPVDLAALASPDEFGGPASGVIASCLAVIRTSHPTRRVRLIPRAGTTPQVAGLEREVDGPNVNLCQTVQAAEVIDRRTKDTRAVWPHVTWWAPGGGRISFGHVMPVAAGEPVSAQVVPLNWNAQAVTYTLP